MLFSVKYQQYNSVMNNSRCFPEITTKLDRKFHCPREISHLYFLTSFGPVYSSANRNNENDEPKSRRKVEVVRFVLECDESTLSRMIEFIPAPIVPWMVGAAGIYVENPGTNKSIKCADFRGKDKRAAAITINQTSLELSNTSFAMGSAKNVLVYRTLKTYI